MALRSLPDKVHFLSHRKFIRSHRIKNSPYLKHFVSSCRSFGLGAALNLLGARNAATVAAALHRKVDQELHLLIVEPVA